MLIRKQQIESLYLARLDASVKSFAAHFRATIPDAINQYDDEALCANIRRGIDRARTYGIVRGSALKQFLALSLLISPDFDDEPATHRYLQTPGMDHDTKLDLLTALLSERLLGAAGELHP